MKPDMAREQHCRAIDRILNAAAQRRTTPPPTAAAQRRTTPPPTAAAQRRTTPPPTAANIVDVNEQEKAMLERAEQTFASQPGLQQTYKTAEAFGRHCLTAARKGAHQ